MSCIFSTPLFGFRCMKQKRKNIKSLSKNFKKKTHQQPYLKQEVNASFDTPNNSADVTFPNSQSQSAATKPTCAINSIPSGVPFEIGGHSFDACDELSVISFSTLKNSGSFDNNCFGQHGRRKKEGVSNKQNTRLDENHMKELYFERSSSSGKQEMLGVRQVSKNDEEDIDNETHFTRMSI